MAGTQITVGQDFFKLYTEAVFTLPKFLEGIRTIAEAMVSNLPEELLADMNLANPEELMSLALNEYAAEFEAYRDTHEEVVRELYPEEQVQTLLDIQTRHPWIREKAIEQLKLTCEKDQENNQRLGEKVSKVIDDFLDKDDRKAITGPMEF